MMKKIIAVLALILMVTPLASAGLLSEDIRLSRIRLGDYGYVRGDELDTYVYVYNENSGSSANDGSVEVRIMDSDVYSSSGSFDLKRNSGEGRNVISDVSGLAPGEYLVRISYTSNDIRRVKYRYITVW